MTIQERDQHVLDRLEAARQQHEALDDLLAFYIELYRVQFEHKAGLPDPDVRENLAMRWRLEGGIAQLTFDQLHVEPDSFAGLVARIARVLLRHNPGWEIPHDDRTAAELVDLAREVFETWDTLTSPKAGEKEAPSGSPWTGEPLALAVGFSLAPYLQHAAEVILPHLDLDRWVHGYCPICGGRTNLGLLQAPRGARRLICSRCNAEWSYARLGCPFCKSKEKQVYYASEDTLYRLYVCPTCNRYLKTVDLRELHREVDPIVERLLTVGMDLAARQEGFGD